MMGPRTWNRREFDVTPNGFFTVLRSSGWFSTVRLPGGFRYLIGEPKRAAAAKADENPTGGQATGVPWHFMQPGAQEHRPARLVLIALAAVAITGILLWCIQNP